MNNKENVIKLIQVSNVLNSIGLDFVYKMTFEDPINKRNKYEYLEIINGDNSAMTLRVKNQDIEIAFEEEEDDEPIFEYLPIDNSLNKKLVQLIRKYFK